MSNSMVIPMRGGRQRSGTTLVEVLVVMVIFLIGILAVVQIFPGGLRVMRQTRDLTVASSLARSEIERIKGRSDQLPEMILPVTASWSGTGVLLAADSRRVPSELGPAASAINQAGNLLDASNNVLGPWQFLSGANVTRRVIGEGGVIPSPRAVGNLYGGLLVLQFAPIVFNANYVEFFEVYGNDMVKRWGDPSGWRTRDWEYYVDELDTSAAEIYLPRGRTLPRNFRMSMTAVVNDGARTYHKDIVTTTPLAVAPDPAGGYQQFSLAPYVLGPGESLIGIEGDTIRVSRMFERVAAFSGDPYEYQLLDTTLGLILFSPSAYNYKERRASGRLVPLVGRVNYDVLDWRILREELRLPGPDRPFYQLPLGNLTVLGATGPDSRPSPGFPVPNGGGTYANRTFALLDLDTGGVFSSASLQIDGSRGVVTFVDKDADPSNGLQMDLLISGMAAPITVNATGRSVRAMYQATGEWAVQVLKTPTMYRASNDAPGVGQYYVGSWNQLLGNPGSPVRIYFPWNDAGKKVTIESIYYRRAGDAANLPPRQMLAQDFVIQGKPADPFGNPYIDITNVDPDAAGFDFAFYGYSVKGVKGASVGVRVLWNEASFSLTNDIAENMRRFNNWMGMWRKSETQTYLQRSEN